MSELTYSSLFRYLEGLGFVDRSRSPLERVFDHPEYEVLLAFSMMGDPNPERPVRGADLLTVNMQLQQRGLLSEPVSDVAARDASS